MLRCQHDGSAGLLFGCTNPASAWRGTLRIKLMRGMRNARGYVQSTSAARLYPLPAAHLSLSGLKVRLCCLTSGKYKILRGIDGNDPYGNGKRTGYAS